jgi:hypothetical protein
MFSVINRLESLPVDLSSTQLASLNDSLLGTSSSRDWCVPVTVETRRTYSLSIVLLEDEAWMVSDV